VIWGKETKICNEGINQVHSKNGLFPSIVQLFTQIMSKNKEIILVITLITVITLILLFSTYNLAFGYLGIAMIIVYVIVIVIRETKEKEENERKASERRMKEKLEEENKRKKQEEERKKQEEIEKIQNEEKMKQEIITEIAQRLVRNKRIQENYPNYIKLSQSRIDEVKKTRDEIVLKYDVDGNELVDDVEENVFAGIIRNNNEVLEKKIGADKVHKLVKLSIYLNKKRDNIQNLFGCLLGMYNDFYKKEEKQEICIAKVLEESDLIFTTNISKFYFSKEEEDIVKDIDKTLYDELNTYKTMLFHSMSMVVSAKKGDLITFFEIYEVFDKLGVFDSNWENEVSNKLSEVSNKLSDVTNKLSEISNKLSEVSNKLSNLQTGIGVLIQSINRMNDEIVGELISLNYVMESSIGSLENSVNYELQGIKSSVNFNNLLTSVNTYQLSKLNSRSNKQLRG
jgi:peptidoglycan hydrolase CwlO-like protein